MTTTASTRRERRAALRASSERILRPRLRKWAYGVTVAAVGVAVWVRWLPPTALPVVLPLAMAVFYVDERGEPKA